MKFYISGPISGLPDGNIAAFRQVQRLLEKRGHEAVVPHDIPAEEHQGDCPRGYTPETVVDISKVISGDPGDPDPQRYPPVLVRERHSSACYLRADLREELTCDAVYMLTGWEYSVGARAEHDTAAIAGLPFFYRVGDVFWEGDPRIDHTPPKKVVSSRDAEIVAFGKWSSSYLEKLAHQGVSEAYENGAEQALNEVGSWLAGERL